MDKNQTFTKEVFYKKSLQKFLIPEKISFILPKIMQKTFSIILPVYHQSQQLSFISSSYIHALRKIKSSFEIIFVVNGNDKQSYREAKRIAKIYPEIMVIFMEDSGWGHAVITGIKHANGKFICYTNSARTRVDDLVAILRYAKRNPGVVIKATRILHLNFLRKLGSTLYNIECRLLLHTPVWDVNGTPKVMPRKIAQIVDLKSKDDLLDAELMAKCIKINIPILEVPILFPPRYSGKSTTKIFSAIKMYSGVFRIRNLLKKP